MSDVGENWAERDNRKVYKGIIPYYTALNGRR